MNYNNPYYNPYQQYPYTNGFGNQQIQNHNIPNNYNTPNQNQQIQTSYLPLTFVNGIEGAKAFIVAPNQVIYLKDSDSNVLFEKKADQQGKYTLTAFELKAIDINEIGKQPKEEEKKVDYLIKEDLKPFVTKSDLNALETIFESKLDKLSNRIEKLARNGINKHNGKGNDYNEQ